MHRNERNLVTLEWSKSLLWNRCCQNLWILHTFACHYSNTKMNLSKHFFEMTLCNNNDQTWSSNRLTSARPLGGRWNPRLSGSGWNTTLGVQQLLMHRKTCLIPILLLRFQKLSQVYWILFPLVHFGLDKMHSKTCLKQQLKKKIKNWFSKPIIA